MTRLVGIALVVAYAFASALALARDRWPRIASSPEEDLPSRYERRLRPLRAALPAYGVVGYASHEGPVLDTTHYVLTRRYVLTAYSLVPVLVVPDARRDLVVGDYPDSAPGRPPEIPAGFAVLRDFGEGVLLLGVARSGGSP